MKNCSKCGILKDESGFSKCSSHKDGLQSQCKGCRKENYENNKEYYLNNKDKIREYRENNKEKLNEYKKEYYKNNAEKIRENQKEYQKNNAEKIREHKKEYYENNKEKTKEHRKEYRENNKEKIRENKKKYYENNKEKILEYRENNKEKILENKKNYCREKCQNDPIFKLKRILRTRLCYALRGRAKLSSAVKDLGCSIEEFKLYLENQFHPGMSWENYGSKWQIDHIIAFKDIDVLDEGQLKIVLSYKNLRPCFAWANLARNSHNDNQIDFSSPTPRFFEIKL